MIVKRKLNVKTLPLVCQELLSNWATVSTYLSTSLPYQEGQGTRRHPQSPEWTILCDEYFLCRLELFTKLVRDYTSCFDRSLTGRDDCGFFVCGQLCKYIRRLCGRCLSSSSIPSDVEWIELLDLDLNTCSKLTPAQFLTKARITDQVSQASKHKAERDLSETKGSRDAIDKLSSSLHDHFANAGRNYVIFLLESVLKHVNLSSELVKGMASFDPQVLFILPESLGMSLFQILVRGFISRRWIREADEQLYLDEYASFVKDLRKENVGIVTSLIYNIVNYLVAHPSLQFRQYLTHIFKLACLCLTSCSAETPVVRFGSINSTSLSCKLGEVIYPVHSYAATVPGCVEVCTSTEALAEFSALDTKFGCRGFANTYDPWTSVDWFGRTSLLRRLEESYTSILQKRGEAPSKKTSVVSSESVGPKVISSAAANSKNAQNQSAVQSRASTSKN